LQKALEELDLALGLGQVRLAQLNDEAAMFGKGGEAGPVAVLAVAVYVTLIATALTLSAKTFRGTPPNAAKTRSWKPVSVPTFTSY
jgi:hypothetical protein